MSTYMFQFGLAYKLADSIHGAAAWSIETDLLHDKVSHALQRTLQVESFRNGNGIYNYVLVRKPEPRDAADDMSIKGIPRDFEFYHDDRDGYERERMTVSMMVNFPCRVTLGPYRDHSPTAVISGPKELAMFLQNNFTLEVDLGEVILNAVAFYKEVHPEAVPTFSEQYPGEEVYTITAACHMWPIKGSFIAREVFAGPGISIKQSRKPAPYTRGNSTAKSSSPSTDQSDDDMI